MEQFKKMIPIHIYMGLTLGGCALWVGIPELIHFAGASSLVYAFLLAIGIGRCAFSYLLIAWSPLCLVTLMVGYVYAVRFGNFKLFFTVTGTELLASGCMIGAKIYMRNYTDLGITLLGLTFRTVFYYWMLKRINKV